MILKAVNLLSNSSIIEIRGCFLIFEYIFYTMKSFFLAFCIVFFVAHSSTAQIAEIKVEGSYAKIYNDKGNYTGNSIYLGNSCSMEGYSSEYAVVKEGSYAKIYDAKASYTGHSIYLGSDSYIKHVSQSAILVKEGSYVKYYNFKGEYTGNSTYEPR